MGRKKRLAGELYRSPQVNHDKVSKQIHCLALEKREFRWESSRHTEPFHTSFPNSLYSAMRLFVFLPRIPLGPQPHSPQPGTLTCRTVVDLSEVRFLLHWYSKTTRANIVLTQGFKDSEVSSRKQPQHLLPKGPGRLRGSQQKASW